MLFCSYLFRTFFLLPHKGSCHVAVFFFSKKNTNSASCATSGTLVCSVNQSTSSFFLGVNNFNFVRGFTANLQVVLNVLNVECILWTDVPASHFAVWFYQHTEKIPLGRRPVKWHIMKRLDSQSSVHIPWPRSQVPHRCAALLCATT